jgi:alpha-D-xyloside xylohydrolase
MLRRLGELGFKVSLWEIPYIDEGTPSYREAANRGFLLTAADGRPIHPDAIRATDGRPRGIPDLTNPDARRWWKDKHRPLLRQGVAAFKTDFGEGVPAEARFWDGVDGVERHNLFPLLYNRTVAEVTAEETGRVGFVWGRSAWAGSQRYPGQWGGDPQTSVAAMAATLRGGLSYALSCPGIWSHDIGGFYGPPPSPALYVRWAQFGMLSPLARAHGTTPREPWEFGERACAIFRDFARLRYRLLPYLMHCAEETAREGLPMLRPVLLEFPDDPATATIDDQYMLGPSLLVAPIFSESEAPVERDLYLPHGDWYEWWTGERVQGGRYVRQAVPLETVPLYVRAGSAIPLGPELSHVDERPVTTERLLRFPPPSDADEARLRG